MKINGLKRLGQNLQTMRTKNAPLVYRKIIKTILAKTERRVTRLTPIKSGNLRGHGLGNTRVTSDMNGAKGTISNTADYAVYVHERDDLKHPKGEYKFLKKALNIEFSKALPVVRAEIKKGIMLGLKP